MFQVIPKCFLLRQHIFIRPLINRTSIKRRYQQGSHFWGMIALPDFFQESSKPVKPKVKMLRKRYKSRASIREQHPRQNTRHLQQLMVLHSARPRKLIYVHPKTSKQFTQVFLTNEPKPTARGPRLNFKQPGTSLKCSFLQEKINPYKVGAATEAPGGTSDLIRWHQHQNSPLLVKTVKNHDESVDTEDAVVKASFSATLTTSPDALLNTIRDICKSLMNMFLPGFSLE